ncbi:chaperone DnaJ protein [Trypanosoma rangeli]|uniref:Chaperone DnaJ protein n=1 Tax=Trypanosoma rangeli TaxID=5698 RepID=A0A3R7NK08_TRYRA|nr:chaperone DnaJ protein [Trypanosoma rangeli]RNF07631.1 chaperone DnaJ protein [Trypanosoma rangeli]|eukprot:RNF07631.1 chaperone DnaJ protein [Trypanosoma rangeli]
MEHSHIEWILENEKNYYDILGVGRGASEKDIRRSYLSLALKLHPDKNIGDEKADAAFRAVGKAYTVLKDTRLRALFDAGGADNLHGFDTEYPSLHEIVVALFNFAAAEMLYFVAHQAHVSEVLRERHGWIEAFISWSPTDDFAFFRKSSRQESRRVVTKLFALVVLLFLCVSVGQSYFQYFSGTPSGAASGVPYHQLSRDNPRDSGAIFTVRVLRDGNMTDVAVWRPSSTSEADARALAQQWIRERCPTEKLFSWASRERYNHTATLRVGRKLRATPSPNRAPKRKWTVKSWKPKFEEFFPVKSAGELYVASPLCGGVG